MTKHAAAPDFDPFLRQASLAALASMGFGKKEERIGPHRYHGISARTRLSVADKRAVASTVQLRQQHHKERVTIQQVSDLTEIAREIESFSKVSRRVPLNVWEKYDRVNKRHKKHEEMITITAKMKTKNHRGRNGGTNDEQRAREGIVPQEGFENNSGPFGGDGDSLLLPDDATSRPRMKRCRPNRRSGGPVPFEGGGGCTFGSGRNYHEGITKAAPSTTKGSTPALMVTRSQSSPSCPSAWGPYERSKLNVLYWELGRPPRRGTRAAREHFHRYTQRHRMIFPRRTAAEEPNEREHWLKLNASKAAFPIAAAQGTAGAARSSNGKSGRVLSFTSDPTTNFMVPVADAIADETDRLCVARTRKAAASVGLAPVWAPVHGRPVVTKHNLRHSGRGDTADTGGGMTAAAASYAAAAAAAAATPVSFSPHARLRAGGAAIMSPFHDPIRPSSPAWAFGGVAGSLPGSRGGSHNGGDRGGNSRGDGNGRGGGRARSFADGGPAADGHDEDGMKPPETELLDYTSLGPQTASHRATSPAFAFSREGLGSESQSMFQADKKPEPGPGSFRPNLSATSTHPSPRCGVLMGGSGPRSRGGGSGGRGGGEASGGSGGGDGSGGWGEAMGGPAEKLATPGPGQYSTWDSIGRQILSTRPSSPVMTFATGEWDLR